MTWSMFRCMCARCGLVFFVEQKDAEIVELWCPDITCRYHRIKRVRVQLALENRNKDL
jgi:hypothetical protein